MLSVLPEHGSMDVGLHGQGVQGCSPLGGATCIGHGHAVSVWSLAQGEHKTLLPCGPTTTCFCFVFACRMASYG